MQKKKFTKEKVGSREGLSVGTGDGGRGASTSDRGAAAGSSKKGDRFGVKRAVRRERAKRWAWEKQVEQLGLAGKRKKNVI